MSTRGHRNFLSGIVSWIFGSPVFRYRWIRWPIAAVLTALGVHFIYSGGMAAGDEAFVVPAIFFVFAFFLMVLPILPLADSWEERRQKGD